MRYLIRIIYIIVISASISVSAQDILITNARIYTLGEQGIIENGSILIRQGKIAEVGTQLQANSDAQVIDAEGKQITPGLVNSFTHLGVVEIDLVEQTVDVATEDKLFSASYTIAPALNPYSTLIPQNRINGLTHAIVAPQSGHHVFAGQGVVIRLGEPESFIVNNSVAVFASYGGKYGGGSRAAAYMRMRLAFIDAKEYEQHKKSVTRGEWRDFSLPLHDLEALLPVIHGVKPLVVIAHRASDIRTLLRLKNEFRLRLVIAGAGEAWLVAQELAAAKVAVIIDPMANIPADFDQLGARLDAAARLQRAGVTVLFTGVDFMGTHSAWLVRQAAGNAAAYGMPAIEAIKSMTLNPAKIFGFADRFGSIEPGKDADLVIWDGDPLELLTRADQVIIHGQVMPMVSRATRLRDRYRKLDINKPHAYRK